VSAAVSPEQERGARRWLLRECLGTATVPLILLWSAGTWGWPMAWVLTGLYAAWVAASALLLWPEHKGLLAERATKRPPGVKGWDTAIMGAVGLLTLGRYAVAGLGLRWGWGPEVPLALSLVAIPAAAAAFALVTWGMVANAWFGALVRIQDDREHRVASGGPYRWVRHPGYVGSILFEICSGLILQSWWATGLGAASAALFLLRTALEDRTLQRELVGYAAYARRVRYRLLPGVW
jgi:protein-S-isoprenylcysteine O-methyltransferase Ste14